MACSLVLAAATVPAVVFIGVGSSWWFWGGVPSLVGVVMAIHTSCRLRARGRRIGVGVGQSDGG